jgi:hypothetical protein
LASHAYQDREAGLFAYSPGIHYQAPLAEGDRGFESSSLQRGVKWELDPTASGTCLCEPRADCCHSRVIRPVAHQAAGRDKFAVPIDRRDSVARCQRHDLPSSARKERIGVDDEPTGPELDERGEGGIDLAFIARLHYIELHPLFAGCFLRISD